MLCELPMGQQSPFPVTCCTSVLTFERRLWYLSLMSRICLSIPTSSSSILWSMAADTSMYLQSYVLAALFPSGIQEIIYRKYNMEKSSINTLSTKSNMEQVWNIELLFKITKKQYLPRSYQTINKPMIIKHYFMQFLLED